MFTIDAIFVIWQIVRPEKKDKKSCHVLRLLQIIRHFDFLKYIAFNMYLD